MGKNDRDGVSAVSQPRRWPFLAASAALALILVVVVTVGLTLSRPSTEQVPQVRLDAAAALAALDDGDLVSLDEQLATHRGEAEFAYLFTSETDPRELGDALASVAGEDGALAPDVDAHAYDIALTDLAGTLALATYGTGDHALPASWREDFISATTTPESFYGEIDDDEPARARAEQDQANKQNLLLLLSRGYWSTDFLEDVTTAYWAFDHEEGDDAWPGVSDDDARYAPAPSGGYLTDGMLALTAALTANPAASKWAFTDFQRETKEVDGSDYELGAFTHYLLFEHEYPEGADGDGVGMTAVLTALSSAIGAAEGPAGAEAVEAADVTSDETGPVHDTAVLQALAQDVKDLEEDSGCSVNPLDYLDCVKDAAKAVVGWVKDWGHAVLDILSLATFAPPPFTVIGVAAAATNATWYVIEGDYAMAGLSLAVAVPGLAFGKIATALKAGSTAERTAAAAEEVATAVKQIRVGAKFGAVRELAEAGATRVEASPGLYAKEKQVEMLVADEIPAAVRQMRFNPPGCEVACVGRRFVDVFDPSSGTAIEVKIGVRNSTHAIKEIQKDVAILNDTSSPWKSVVWRFYPDAGGRVGPSAAVRAALLEYRIPYVMYLP